MSKNSSIMKIDGRKIAEGIFEELKTRVKKLQEKNITPNLVIILVGDDPASIAYVRQKEIRGKLIGAKIDIQHFPSSISQSILLSTIQQFNNNNNIHGIIVQQPLSPHIDLKKITNFINPKKDIDGFRPQSKFESPIAAAVLEILKEIHASTPGVEPQFIDWLKNKKIVVIGKGETGGKPIIQSLKKMGVQTFVIDSKTPNPLSITKNADIITSAVGKPKVIKPEMIKNQSILISIGLSKGKDGKLHGDYEEDEIKDIASFYTPTPGGVGPVNVAMLLKNLIISAET